VNQNIHIFIIFYTKEQNLLSVVIFLFQMFTEAHPIDPGALQCCSGQRDLDFKAHVESQLLASLDPEVFSSLRGERLPKRTTKPPRKPKQSAKSIYIPSAPPATSPTIKPGTLKTSPLPIQQSEPDIAAALDVVKVPTTTLKPHNQSGHIDGDITGVGTVELVHSEFRRKKKELVESESPLPSVSPPPDTRPSFSGNDQKSNSAYRADQELLDLPSAVDGHMEGTFTLPTFVKQFLSTKQFDPQAMLERLRANKRFDLNATWNTDYKLLYCPAQPFLQRVSVMGEFFETLS